MARGAGRGGRGINPLAWFWIYTAMRIVLFGVLFGLLWLFGLRGFIGAFVALILTVPLSFVLLARPRAMMIGSMAGLRSERQARTAALDVQLQGEQPAAAPEPRSLPGTGPAGDPAVNPVVVAAEEHRPAGRSEHD